ncbi:MAG: hypothetical protein K6F53_00045 [Lachnospiraceae bacterium]|nr:hypothetical protein [Lachnospiraceae bacterium]
MKSLLVLRQHIINFVGKNEVYLKPVFKLLLSLIALLFINRKLGYMQKIDNTSVVLIAALMCSFMPMNFIVLIAAIFVLLHMYALSIECAAVTLVIFVILFLLYFRFSPKDTIVVVLTPILQILGVPYIIPVSMGLLGNPASAVSVGCGLIVSYMLKTINGNAAALSSMETEDVATRFRLIIDSLLDNKLMILMIAAFGITIILVYVIRRLPMDYSWPAAIITGAIAQSVLILVGSLMLDVSVSKAGIIVGSLLAIVIGFVIQFIWFNVDYSRTEKVQFEDDDYYYYVKAVPKANVSMPQRTVKKINTAKRRPQSAPVRTRVKEEED